MDQAKGLRNIVKKDALIKKEAFMASENRKYPRVIAVTSGKGGVGKTNIVGNMAVALSRAGKRVVIIDADVGLANIDIIFNLRPQYSIRHVVSSEMSLQEVMVTTDHGISIIPGGSGFADLTQLSEGEKLNLIGEFEALADISDVIFVDTGAGISSNVLYFNSTSDECIVIATKEPTSITDAYALMKVMSQQHDSKYFKLIVNMVDNEKEAKRVYAALSSALDKFLKDVVLEYAGFIPFDPHLQKAVQKRGLIMDLHPLSPASKAMEDLAVNLVNTTRRPHSQGNLKFFVNKMLGVAN